MVHLPLEKLHKCSPQIGWIFGVVPEDGTIIIIIITVTFPHIFIMTYSHKVRIWLSAPSQKSSSSSSA